MVTLPFVQQAFKLAKHNRKFCGKKQCFSNENNYTGYAPEEIREGLPPQA